MRSNCGSAHDRGRFVIRPTIPGIFLTGAGRRARTSHLRATLWQQRRYRLKLAFVPGGANLTELFADGLGNAIDKTMMQSEPEGDLAGLGERHIITRDIDPLKRIPLLKVAKT